MNYVNLEHFNYSVNLPFHLEPYSNDTISIDESRIMLSIYMERPGNVLEIGTYKGVTTANFARITKEFEARVISVDISEPIKDKKIVLPRALIGLEIPPQYRDYIDIKLINPNEEDSLQNLLLDLGTKFNFIFIDGDHDYSSVRKDYHVTLPYLTDYGVTIFHDVWWDKMPPPEDGPIRFLNEIGGVILSNTHLGIPKSQLLRLTSMQSKKLS